MTPRNEDGVRWVHQRQEIWVVHQHLCSLLGMGEWGESAIACLLQSWSWWWKSRVKVKIWNSPTCFLALLTMTYRQAYRLDWWVPSGCLQVLGGRIAGWAGRKVGVEDLCGQLEMGVKRRDQIRSAAEMGHETGGIGCEGEKEEWRSTVRLQASLAGVLCGFQGNAFLELGARIKHSQHWNFYWLSLQLRDSFLSHSLLLILTSETVFILIETHHLYRFLFLFLPIITISLLTLLVCSCLWHFFYFCEKWLGNFENTLSLSISFDSLVIFTMLTLSNHEHSRSFHLLLSYCMFLSRAFKFLW